MKNCKSCGFPLDKNNHELCFYCFAIRPRGASKFILFLSMLDAGNKFLTIQEILELTNAYRTKIKKPSTTYSAIYQILHRYSKYPSGKGNLLLKQQTSYNKLNPQHKKIRGRGASNQPMNLYKLSAKLKRRVNRYLKRWNFGLSISINSNGKKLLLKSNEKQKARAIKNKISAGEYDVFEFLLV